MANAFNKDIWNFSFSQSEESWYSKYRSHFDLRTKIVNFYKRKFLLPKFAADNIFSSSPAKKLETFRELSLTNLMFATHGFVIRWLVCRTCHRYPTWFQRLSGSSYAVIAIRMLSCQMLPEQFCVHACFISDHKSYLFLYLFISKQTNRSSHISERFSKEK